MTNELLLQEALDREDYELAAVLRDRIAAGELHPPQGDMLMRCDETTGTMFVSYMDCVYGIGPSGEIFIPKKP